MGFAVAMGLAVVVAVGWPDDASGKDKTDQKKDTAKQDDKKPKFDPNNRTAISEFMFTVVDGNTRFAAKDFTGALESYKKAVTLAPNDPLGHYLIAEAQLAQGNIADGEAALAQAEKLGDKRPDVLGKIYFLQADAKERQKKWEESRAAWAKYDGFAQRRGGDGGVFPQTAAARIQAIDEMVKLDKSYEDVRRRIAAEKDGGAAPSKPPSK
jgi:predicted Zn-dependent protease